MAGQSQPGRSEQSRRLAQYDDLLRFASAVNAERSFEDLFEFVTREAATVMRADRASIFLLNPDKKELWSRVAMGVGDQVIRFPASRGIAGHVVSSGELLNVPDPYADQRFNPDIDRQTGYRTKSILCAPLRARHGELIGALQVLNKLEAGPFTAEDERLIGMLATQCAVAIENAMLYDQLRAAAEHGAQLGSAAPKVLLADDDEALEMIVAEALGENVRIIRAPDGEDALEKLDSERPDLILLDIIMPKKDGLETCRALRAREAGRDIPVIMLTASRRPEDVIEAFQAGANDYLVKPFALAQLRAKTQTWLLRQAGS